MKFSAKEIANILNGKIEGDESIKVSALAKIEEGKSGDLCFLSNPKYTPHIYKTKASVIIVDENFKAEKPIKATLIIVEDSYSAFSKLLNIYNKMKFDKVGISQNTDISKNVSIAEDVYIGPFCSVGENVKIGRNVKIFPNCFIGDDVIIKENTVLFSGVKIYHGCKLGANNIIHSGCVIGSDGFGFAPNKENNYKKISQIGNVLLEDDIEIGANTTIDRATMGSTIIRKGVKLDNQIQVAHNVEIGENTVIAAQVAIAGSSKIGKDCMIGGNTAIAGHISIANKVRVAGHSGIAASINEVGKTVQGPMAFDLKQFQRSYIIFKRLPEMYKTLEQIVKEFKKN